METVFSTEEQRKAKNWDILEQGKALKASLARLENEYLQYAASWKSLAYCQPFGYDTSKVVGERIQIARPKPRNEPGTNIIASVPLAHLNEEKILELLAEIEQTKMALKTVESQLESIGHHL